MQQTEAIKTLIRAVQVAQQKGAYTLEEASTIHQACSAFINTTDSNTLKKDSNSEDKPVNNLDENAVQ